MNRGFQNRLWSVAFAAAVAVAVGRASGFFAGTIESVSAAGRSLTVRGAKSTMTFVVPETARIVGPQQEESTFADLKSGDEVTVDYTEERGLCVAHTVTLKAGIPPPPPGGGADSM